MNYYSKESVGTTYYDQTSSQAELDCDDLMSEVAELTYWDVDRALRALTRMHKAVEERIYRGLWADYFDWTWDTDNTIYESDIRDAFRDMQTWVEL